MEPVPKREGPVTRPYRVGLFGGTFDPPHCGHVAVAADVADALRLDRVIWMPAGEPPHKHPHQPSDARVRLEMAQAAAAADSRFVVESLEIERPGPSWTVDTVRALRERFPDAELFVIVGVDQYRELDTWRDPAEILELAHLAVMDRGGASAETVHPRVTAGLDTAALASLGDDRDGPLPPVVFVPVRRVDVSSSELRAALRSASGTFVRTVTRRLAPAVLAIVEREGLYGGARDG